MGQVFLLVLLLVLMYFDLRGSSVAVSGTFLLLNIGLTWYSLKLGPGYYGWGYVLACFGGILVGMGFLINRLKNCLLYTSPSPRD